ncbi:glycerophosphoryl diester phosphodiesterase membrane domain-containing protein [Streptomyces phytohabitans]|uniref:glycerophosphoryl diester phosphodiesterase membrane domain-containing protein n=1 Tax=Streptomyces phytohabitans TaxID=1150371 RepID=UPI00345B7A52
MNDTPGWASPGSSPSDPSDDREDKPSDAPRKTPPDGQAPADPPPSNWSAQQPPPAQGPGWGAPPTPPPYGQQGWGNWNNAWNQPPPAARPGVIPLRPLGIGEILDGAVASARAHWRTALGIALGVAVVVQCASTVASGIWLRDNSSLEALESNQEPSSDELADALTGTLSWAGVELLATVFGTVVATAMLTIVVSRAVLGRPVTTREAWREARPRLGSMLGLTLLVLLIVMGAVLAGFTPGLLIALAGAEVGGSLLAVLGGLAGTVAAVWLWVRYSLAAPALMLEKQGVTTALRRSAKLVHNSWWRTFGIQLLAVLLVTVVGYIVRIPTTVVASIVDGDGMGGVLSATDLSVSWTYLAIIGVGAVLASTVTLPLSAGITALLYMDQRIRREALDLELARAAGVDDAASPPSAGPPPGS